MMGKKAEGYNDDDEVYYARGPPAQRALLLIYYINSSVQDSINAFKPLQYQLQNLVIPAVFLTLNLSNAVVLVVVLLKGYSLSV